MNFLSICHRPNLPDNHKKSDKTRGETGSATQKRGRQISRVRRGKLRIFPDLSL